MSSIEQTGLRVRPVPAPLQAAKARAVCPPPLRDTPGRSGITAAGPLAVVHRQIGASRRSDPAPVDGSLPYFANLASARHAASSRGVSLPALILIKKGRSGSARQIDRTILICLNLAVSKGCHIFHGHDEQRPFDPIAAGAGKTVSGRPPAAIGSRMHARQRGSSRSAW